MIDKKYLLTMDDIYYMLRVNNICIPFIDDCKTEIVEYDDESHRYVTYAPSYAHISFCEHGNGVVREGTFCPECGAGFMHHLSVHSKKVQDKIAAISKEIRDKYGECPFHTSLNHVDAFYSSIYKESYTWFFVKEHPEYDNGALIFRVKITLDMNSVDFVSYKTLSVTEIVPGKIAAAYKVGSKKLTEIDAFEAFSLSSNFRKMNAPVIYNNADNLIDFIYKNPKFSSQTAFMQVFGAGAFVNIFRDSFFLIYMCIYACYPVVELLAKMNFSVLLADIVNEMAVCCNKNEMYAKLSEAQKLVNPETTKGSMALNIPKYISEYLNNKYPYCLANKNDDLYSTFLFWCEVCAFGAPSKEQFHSITTSPAANDILNRYNRREVLNILRYGYTLDKLLSYCVKQATKADRTAKSILSLLIDYRRIAETGFMDVEPYPEDVVAAHDRLVPIVAVKNSEDISRKLMSITEYIKTKYNFEHDELTAVFPSTIQEFIDEGNNQRNCVAHYGERMARGNTLVFFIRRKDDINQSFITAEFHAGKIRQLKYKFNADVRNSDIINFANDIAKAFASDKVLALY